MNLTAISIAWAFLQIALLCSLSLIVALLLRGRRPQLVTAMLAGTCIASLLLAMISVVPRFQWTLAVDEAPQRPVVPGRPLGNHLDKPNSVIHGDSEGIKPQVSTDQSESANSKTAIGPNRFDAIRNFLSLYLQRVDREVREAEVWQQPVAKARNFSLLLIVLSGLGAMSLLWCSSWLFMRRVLRCSQLVNDRHILNLVASQAREFGLRRTPSVRESMLVPIGATVGWRRVTVLLHTDWREWSTDERTAVIAHELAHAARHDFAWVIISSWTRILLFFHPMVHALIHRLRLEQELAADQLAAGKVGNAKAYGRALASLALRSQQSLVTSNARLGSMLAAGQICVTRRVTMLRQGSLKPIQSRSHWSIWAVAAIACTAIPIAGLRGITQDPVAETKPNTQTPKEKDPVDPASPKPLSKEFLAAYPPVELVGSMVYRPGRFRAGEFGPEAAWFQEWFAISVLGKPMPDRATVHGECKGILKWYDEERMHGGFDLSAGFREGESTLPGQLTKLVDPFTGNPRRMRTVSTMQMDGRFIHGVTNSTATDEPEKWLIDDEQGYFLGSQEHAVEFARGQKFALDSIPETFREDYQNAAFGMVYDHCDQWPSKLEAFYKGSPREEEFQVFGFKPPTAIFNDLLKLGVFVDGCKTPACSMRAVMRDERAAKRLVTQLTTLVELGKVAIANMPSDGETFEKEASSSILETMKITANGSDVHFEFDIFAPSLADSSIAAFRTSAGWINFNAVAKCETDGSVTVKPEMTFSSPPRMFGQTLDASDYRGKTVLLELDMQCNEDVTNESGAFVWASRQEQSTADVYLGRTPRQQGSPYTGHRVLSAKTMAANSSSSWSDSSKVERLTVGVALSSEAPNRTLKVPFKVPNDAQHLSFGCYCKNSEIRMSNVKFEVVEDVVKQSISQSGIMDATEDVPCNVMVVPGYTIRKLPIELNFEQSAPKSVEFAARPTGNQSR